MTRAKGRARAAHKNRGPRPFALVGATNPVLRYHAADGRAALDDLAPGHAALLIDRLVATCRAKRGVALAACQAGYPVGLVALANGAVWANVHVEPLGETEVALEGCLSIPGRWYAVERALSVRVFAYNVAEGEYRTFVVDEPIVARMWQHEADHLRGVLISDHWPETSERDGVPLPAGVEVRLGRETPRVLLDEP